VLKRLMSEFQAVGYQISEPVQILNAANFGVPQKRRRLFLLGNQIGVVTLAYPDPELEMQNLKLNRETNSQYLTVREAIADLPNLEDFAELHKTDCMQLTPEQVSQIHDLATPYVKKLRDLIVDPGNFAYSRFWNLQLLTSSMRTQHTESSIERFGTTLPGKVEPISRLRRLDWNQPCYTLRAGTSGDRGSYTSPRPLHPHYPRVISVREAARLHSFPDWFRFHTTKWHGFREVGNAVPPLLARVLGRQIMAALGVKPSVPTITLQLGDPQLLKIKYLKASKYWKAPERPTAEF
jgi:DNA (cytosine-5)-methyltransferase 1